MNANYEFEFIAKVFEMETGYLRPGKDDAGMHNETERREAWDAWWKANHEQAKRWVRSAELILLDEPSDL